MNANALPVSSAPEVKSQGFAWFGKLPSAGDFISRRMPYAVQQFWDRWCAGGMEVMKERNQMSGWGFWGNTPKWAFVLPAQPGVPFGQLGVFAPSCDRVGRNFPFLVTTAVFGDSAIPVLQRAAPIALAWSDVIAKAQISRAGIESVDAQLESVLSIELAKEPPLADGDVTLPPGVSPASLPWPGLAETFDLRGSESYWWSVPPADTGYRARTHTGPLQATQFCGLFL